MKPLSEPINSVTACIAFVCIFVFLLVWKYLALDGATVPALGALMATYLILSMRNRHLSTQKKPSSLTTNIIPVVVLVLVVCILIIGNGGLSSPLFFLLSFLLFAIAFVLPPITVFVFTASMVLLFLPEGIKEGVTELLIHFGSLVLLTPIAYFFGREFQNRSKKSEASEDTVDRIRREAASVLRDNQNMSEDNKIQLADIIQETDELRKN